METAAGVVARRFFTATAPMLTLLHPLSQDEMRNVLRSYDAAQASTWHGCANASPPDKEDQMHSVNKLRAIGARRANLRSTESHSRAAPGARIWTWLLAALHESRKQEAARVIRRHQDLIQNFQAIELPGRGMDPKTHA